MTDQLDDETACVPFPKAPANLGTKPQRSEIYKNVEKVIQKEIKDILVQHNLAKQYVRRCT